MNHINNDYIDQYLESLSNYQNSEVMKEMIQLAEKEHIPILRPTTASLLHVLVKASQPRIALEIGTSIGYSSLVLLQSMEKHGRLVTVELDEGRRKIAQSYFEREGVLSRVTLLTGDAGEVLHFMDSKFDLIFLDGPKAQYIHYLPDCLRVLNEGGLLICDDVLFYGMVAKDQLIRKRKITIVKRMRRFLQAISDHPQLNTTIIPIGDGLSVSYKKEGLV